MTQPQNAPQNQDESARTVFTAFELSFVLGLDATDSAAITREEMSLRTIPEEAEPFVEAAVTSGLRARGKISPGEDGQWLLGDELQTIAAVLTGADRWLGLALAEGPAMRTAFIVDREDVVLMFTQDELETFLVTVIESSAAVPPAVANVIRSFLGDGTGRTVSLRRIALASKDTVTPLMFHAQEGSGLQIAHEPVTADGTLTVSDTTADQIEPALARLWEDGVSAAARS